MLDYVRAMADKSVCKRRGVACLVFDRTNGDTMGWGVNGPAGYRAELCSGIKDGCGCAHSEINTLLSCHPTKRQLLDHVGHMIATRAPCVPCATAIVNCGFISELTYLDPSEPGSAGLALLEKCGIHVHRHDDGRSQGQLKETAASSGATIACPGCGHQLPRGSRCPMCGA